MASTVTTASAAVDATQSSSAVRGGVASRPSIDHSMLSPSGRVSERTRKAATRRAAATLFPPGNWDRSQSEEQKRAELVRQLQNQAKRLRELAARGMRRRKFTQEAARIEAEIATLIGEGAAR